jgi:zinc finger CCCH domain-containing protein 13
LRLTVKAFIKSEEKKRDKERTSAAGCAVVPPTPTNSVPPATPVTASVEQQVDGGEVGIKEPEVDGPLQSPTKLNNGKTADSVLEAESIEEQDVSLASTI